MSNKIKTSGTTTKPVATRNTNFKIGIDGLSDYGPTNISEFYSGIVPPNGGYVIYVHKNSQGPSIHVANNDSECIFFLKSFGSTGNTINEVLSWSSGRTDMWVQSTLLSNSDIDNSFINPNLTIGSAVSVVSQSPFSGGGNSYQFSSSVNSYISTPGSLNWAVGTDDFTVEWFSYQTSTAQFQRIFTVGDYPNIKLGVSIEMSTFYYWNNNTFRFSSASSTVTNTWYHWAVVRQAGVTKIYRNGILRGSQINDNNNITDSTTSLIIGNTNLYATNAALVGYLTNFRFVKGLAVYTGNFTVPTSSLTSISDANPYGGTNTQSIPNGYTKLLLVP